MKEIIDTFLRARKKIPEVRYIGDPVLRQLTQAVDIEEGKKI